MFRVRHYDKYIHPDHFQRGVLGKVIRVLNWTRWKLETVTQRLVLEYLNREEKLDKESSSKLIQKFELDVQAEKVEKKRTSPLAPFFQAPTPLRRQEEFVEPTKVASASIEDMVLRYGNRTRARRYGLGHRRLVYDEFEAVPPEENAE
jgi:hypothetical protein